MVKNGGAEFFALCEFYLSDPQTSAKSHRNFSEKILFYVVRYLGGVGLLAAYSVMVLRNTRLSLPCLRDLAILDINAKLILNRDDIRRDLRLIDLRRRHMPSRGVLTEMLRAYKRRNELLRTAQVSVSGQPISLLDIAVRAAPNEMYLIWLLHFYVHRSTILANAESIKASVNAVLTLEEFTPQIAGYLSAFAEMNLPLILYSPVKLSQPHLTLQAAPLFEKVMVKNAYDAGVIFEGGCDNGVLEKNTRADVVRICSDVGEMGIFLASFYNLNEAELECFIENAVIPTIRRFQEFWQPRSVKVFCHPSDRRAEMKLRLGGIEVAPKEFDCIRMTRLDLAICGNTSVVEEALSFGLPVIYCGLLDRYSHDLSGYVRDGMVIDGTYQIPTSADLRDFYEAATKRDRFDSVTVPKMSLLEVVALTANKVSGRRDANPSLPAAHFSGTE